MLAGTVTANCGITDAVASAVEFSANQPDRRFIAIVPLAVRIGVHREKGK